MQFLILYYDELHNGGCKHYTSLIQSKIVTTKIQLQPKQNPIVTPQQEHNTTSTQPQHSGVHCAHHPTHPPQKLNGSLQEPQINILLTKNKV